jgi:surfeit locus 1 family protein
MRRLILPLLFGVVGVAVLTSLGIWQLARNHEKQAILDRIETRIAIAPVDLPAQISPDTDRYLAVRARGEFTQDYVRVLVSHRDFGPAYRIISAFETQGRRVLVDRGLIPTNRDVPPVAPPMQIVTGHLHWPQETDAFTPANDVAGNIWFARDVAALADHLQTEPVLIIAANLSPPDTTITPLPVTIDHIPDNHLSYAIQWFGLALVWFGMTVYFIRRMRPRRI